MDFIDNLIYTSLNNTGFDPTAVNNRNRIALVNKLMSSASLPIELGTTPQPASGTFGYPASVRQKFIHLRFPDLIDDSFEKHWYDISDKPAPPPAAVANTSPHYFTVDTNQILTRLDEPPLYHMMYAYLIENTRIGQIMDRLLFLYHSGEDIGITNDFEDAFRWLINTEYLFYKPSNSYSIKNITSLLRPDYESNRRNAYYRMFGVDLAFGNGKELQSTTYNYIKAKASNTPFIPLFEQFLAELWQAYINADNTSGANATDVTSLVDLAGELKEFMRDRRGTSTNYTTQNLSREEFSSCFMMTWYHFIVSYSSPLVQFLKCEAPTSGDRLLKIGLKVGLPAHSKSKTLIELAGPTADLLRLIENDSSVFHNPTDFTALIQSKGSGTTLEQFLNDLILLISNWEKATGHKLKNRESNIRGTVSVSQTQRTNGRLVSAN